ncbi:MAG TPA: flagellar basal body P-ring formation chaperone FlgA [Steroidobacteraceae bacterium]
MKRVSGIRRIAWALTVVAVSGFAWAQERLQSLEEVRSAAEEFVRQKIPESALRVRITAGQLDSRLRLPACDRKLETGLLPGGLIGARTTVAVSCKDGANWTVYVPVTVVTEVPVLVLNRAGLRGERISPSDVEVQVREVVGTGESYLRSVEELSGRTLKRPLPAGTALTADVLIEDVLVRRGQQVTLLAGVPGLEVRATGRALNDARAAGRVRVQNISSNEVVEGTVERAGVVRVSP